MAKIIVCNMKNANIDPNYYEDKIKNIKLTSADLILCPKTENIKYFKSNNYYLGLQDIDDKLSKNIKYVIVGHSYRRNKCNETNKVINSKIKLAINNNLKVILCIGESKLINILGLTNYYLKWQINRALKGINIDNNLIVAYEPLYSIGNISINNKLISKRTKYIKKSLNFDVPVIYGGGVNDKNIDKIVKLCDGVMLGSGSFDVDNLLKKLNKFTM